MKSKDRQIQDLKDELNKLRLSSTQLEAKIRDSSGKQQEAEERMKYY